MAISSQKTMKLAKVILWVEIFTNYQKSFDNVIVMLILLRHQNETAEKIADFLGFG